jgi:serine/threonine-protein kinase
MLEPSARGSELRERFAREALFLSNVTSNHVSRILGYGFDQGQPFLVLERLVGETLDAKLRRDGPVPPRLAYDWIEQLLVGVRDIHTANVIHRDLKPANIFIQREGPREIVKVIDFGVARLLEATDDGSQGLTSASHLLGSVGYMAPEQFAQASKVTAAADLYAVGVVIFRMITGQLPFVSKQIEAVIRMKRDRDPPLLSSMPGAPSRSQLDWFVGKCLSRDLTQRFQTTREAQEVWARIRPTFELEEDLTTRVDQPRSWLIPHSEAPKTGAAHGYVESFVRTPQTPQISTMPEPPPEPEEGHGHGPMTMLSPGQRPKIDVPNEPAPQSRTGVDIQIPASWEVSFEEAPPERDEWDAVTEKRKAPDILRFEREAREAHERKKNK